MNKKVSHTRTKLDPYIAFVQNVHLQGIGLDEASVHVDREMLAALSVKVDSFTNELEGKTHLERFDDESFVVLAKYRLKVLGEKDLAPVEISATFSALFQLSRKAKESMVRRFAEDECRLIFWPYIRHFVSDTTYRMSIHPILLPLTSDMRTEDED